MTKDNRISRYKNLLLNAAGKLADYENYFITLLDLNEKYDETLELYKWDEWDNEAGITIASKASHMLSVTLRLFSDMRDNAIYELYHVIKDIAGFPVEEQRQICGMVIDPSLQDETVFRDMIFDWEDPPYNQDEARDSFLALMQSHCNPSP